VQLEKIQPLKHNPFQRLDEKSGKPRRMLWQRVIKLIKVYPILIESANTMLSLSPKNTESPVWASPTSEAESRKLNSPTIFYPKILSASWPGGAR